MLRPGRDDDAARIIALVGACWAEYPGCVMDMVRENHELHALASDFAQQGGTFWAAERDGDLLGIAGVKPHGDGVWEICKVYVDAPARGAGVANALLAEAEGHARAAGATRLTLWSDTRFDRAHRFYERHGYIRAGGIRALGDLSNSLEFGYAKPLAGLVVQSLDTAAASSAARALGRILVACVEDGASVSFLPPLPLDTAAGFYRDAARAIATGGRVLLAAWHEGHIAGSVMLDLATPPNQPHRAEVQKLLVHPALRRHGIGRALMAALEEEARRAGRRLLTLDTKTGDAAEALYRGLGWTEAGRIPGFALDAAGQAWPTTIFWKDIG